MLIHCRQPVPLNGKLNVTLIVPRLQEPHRNGGGSGVDQHPRSGRHFRPRAMGVKFLNVEGRTERLLAELAAQYDAYGSIYSCYYA